MKASKSQNIAPVRRLASTAAIAKAVDSHIGNRLRARRTLLGMSQEKLSRADGLTFQQIQKYERGVNRIGASRLFNLSRILDVPVSFFFEDLPAELPSRPSGSTEHDQKELKTDRPVSRETSGLIAEVTETDHPFISPRKMEEVLEFTRVELLTIGQVNRNTFTRNPRTRKLQDRMGQTVKIIAAAEDLLGDRVKAIAWFRFQPVAEYDYKTPLQLVSEGHAEAVIAYIQHCLDGSYA